MVNNMKRRKQKKPASSRLTRPRKRSAAMKRSGECPSIKSAFEEVARGWLLLAEQMEWIDGRRSSLRDEDTSN